MSEFQKAFLLASKATVQFDAPKTRSTNCVAAAHHENSNWLVIMYPGVSGQGQIVGKGSVGDYEVKTTAGKLIEIDADQVVAFIETSSAFI